MVLRHDHLTIIGRTDFRSERRPFGMRIADRRHHLYVVGKTGTGKSTLLEALIRQDLAHGLGLALLDPHGDLVARVLTRLPHARRQNLVFLDVPDQELVWGFNPLRGVPPAKRAAAASGILEVMKKIWADSWGPRLEHILRNALLALLDQPQATLADVLRLLSDDDYRREAMKNVSSLPVRAFWLKEYEKYPARFRLEAIAPIQNKVGAFLANPLLYRLLTSPTRPLGLRRVMDERKVFLVNLAKGKIGEDTAALLGALLVSSLAWVAMSRAELPEEERADFFLYLDEFHAFTTLSLATMLSELRKYRTALTLSHQHHAQIPREVREAILGNVGSLIAFRVGPTDAETLAEEFAPHFGALDLMNLPNHRAYVKLMVDGAPAPPFSAAALPPSH